MADYADGVYTVRSTRVEATEHTVCLSSEVDDRALGVGRLSKFMLID